MSALWDAAETVLKGNFLALSYLKTSSKKVGKKVKENGK